MSQGGSSIEERKERLEKIYTYDTMKEIYRLEKEKRMEEQKKKEQDRFERTLLYIESTILDTVKQGFSKIEFIAKRLLDEKKKPFLNLNTVDLYIDALKKKFPDVEIEKKTGIATLEDMMFSDSPEVLKSIEVKWKKFESDDEEEEGVNGHIS